MRLFSVPLRRLLLALCITGPASGAQVKTLTILHTNDMHAAFVPHEAVWVKTVPRPMIGGMAELAFVADSIRAARGATLMLDAGDVMTGTPITEHPYAGAQGGALFTLMNAIGYDAWCPGNHDFDVSQENLRALVRIAKFPTLCANLVDTLGRPPVGNIRSIVLRRGGLRIGVFGLISQELYDLVNQNNLTGIRVLSPLETARAVIAELQPETDLIIALTHQGVEEDSALAAGVHGLAVIVGGHSHTRLRRPKVVNGVLIVQTGANAENLGELDLTFDAGHLTAYEGKLIPLWHTGPRGPSAVTSLVDSLQRVIDREFDAVIGTLEGNWTRSESQSAIGTFLADAQREAAGAQIGFMNNGGIRRDVPAGPLTRKVLFEILPFRNLLATFQLTGRELRAVMVHNIATRPGIQIAGMSGRWTRRPGGGVEFTSIEVGGRPLEDGRSYICAASDFFVGEAERYLGLEIRLPVYLKATVYQAVESVIRARKEITPRVTDTIEQEQ